MKDIKIDVGVCTELNIDLSNVDFSGIDKVIFTIKNHASVKSKVIVEREFTEAKEHRIIIEPEESIELKDGALYDFNKVLVTGIRKKMTDNGNIILRNGVGACV